MSVVAFEATVTRMAADETDFSEYEAIIESHIGAEDVHEQAMYAWALSAKGSALAERAPEEGIALLDQVIERFGGASETELRALVAFSLYRKGVVLHLSHRTEEAAAACSVVLEHFRRGESESIDRYLAAAAARLQKIRHPTPWV